MLKILPSKAPTYNPNLKEVSRRVNENNLQWLARNFPKQKDVVYLLLLGGDNPIDFRLREAQSHARSDFTPSHWSHVVMIGKWNRSIAKTKLYEISLQPTNGFEDPVSRNGLQISTLDKYGDDKKYPNIALLYFKLDFKKVEKTLKTFQYQRVALDALELIIVWLSYVWGVGKTGNPLLEGMGLPSAAMIESVINATGFELTPGLSSSSSCPEAIWQTAKWWHDYYINKGESGISGCWYAPFELIKDEKKKS